MSGSAAVREFVTVIIAVEETTTSMSVDAAKKALADAAVAAEEIDLIIAATVSSDYIFPTLACEIQAQSVR